MEEVMLSRRHSSAMLSSPRRPSSTMRIFSSAEKCRRGARRMSLTTVSAGPFAGPDVCFIFAPDGYDEPEILRSPEPSVCLMGADAGQSRLTKHTYLAVVEGEFGTMPLRALEDPRARGLFKGWRDKYGQHP